MLRRRFGELSATDQARIAQAELAELECWLDRALDASTLAAVFAADDQPAARWSSATCQTLPTRRVRRAVLHALSWRCCRLAEHSPARSALSRGTKRLDRCRRAKRTKWALCSSVTSDFAGAGVFHQAGAIVNGQGLPPLVRYMAGAAPQLGYVPAVGGQAVTWATGFSSMNL